jgi:hypothetical protein
MLKMQNHFSEPPKGPNLPGLTVDGSPCPILHLHVEDNDLSYTWRLKDRLSPIKNYAIFPLFQIITLEHPSKV